MSSQPDAEVDDGPVVFFVHVMKTGGTTVLQSLLDTYPAGTHYPQNGIDELLPAKGSPHYLFNLDEDRRLRLRLLGPHLPLSAAHRFQQQSDRATEIVLLLREGFDRSLSHLRQISRRFDHEYTYRQILDLPLLGEFFLSNHQTRALSATDSNWTEWEQCFDALRPLRRYLDDPPSSPRVSPIGEADLARAIEGLNLVTELGLQDEFDHWWTRCHLRFGWPASPAPSVNVADAQEQRSAPPIPQSVIDELRERNTLDVRLYEAAKQHLTEQVTSETTP